jgi:hypothetical protein
MKKNQGPGPREDEGVDTEYADNGGPNVGWIIAGEWIEYTISVEDTVGVICRASGCITARWRTNDHTYRW